MEIEYLNELIVLAEEGRFSEAAEKLYTTSSSLSKHIRSLESELGVELFDRSKRCAVINKYGEALLPFAKEIVKLRRDAQRSIDEKKRNETGILNINSNYRMFEEAIDFHKDYGVNVIINEEPNSKELLETGECELAMMINPDTDDAKLECIKYKKDRLVMLCNRDHPLAKRDVVDVRELENENFVTFANPNNHISVLAERAFKEAGFEPNVTMTASVGSTIARLVAQKMGIAFLWEKALKPVITDAVKIVPIYPIYEVQVSLCYLRGAKLSENAKDFIIFLSERERNE
ncbi:MAG: LysR family transcriptional regulator [Lachnospiraceae bacterium]|nr:LysR family transcriptional regulator [Lachnospiraceae bacterium]